MSPWQASGTRLAAQIPPASGTARSASRTTRSHHFAAQNRCPYRRFAVAGAIPDPLRAAPGATPVLQHTGGEHGAYSAYRGTAGRTRRVHQPARAGADLGRTAGGRGADGGARPGDDGGRIGRHTANGSARRSVASVSRCSQTVRACAHLRTAITAQPADGLFALRLPRTAPYREGFPRESTNVAASGKRRVTRRSAAELPTHSDITGRASRILSGRRPTLASIWLWRGGSWTGVAAAGRRSRQGERGIGGQDKGPRCAARGGRCSSGAYAAISRGAAPACTSHPPCFLNLFRGLTRCAGLLP